MPVAQAFFVDDPVLDEVTLDAVVTLVDAAHIEAHLDDVRYDGITNQAVDQIVCADRIIINKIDLVAPLVVDRVRGRIEVFNQRAEITTSSYAEVNLDGILGIKAFELSQRAAAEPSFLDNHFVHSRDPDIESFTLRIPGELDGDLVGQAAGTVAAEYGPDLLRWKGILAVHGSAERIAFQGVHSMFEMHELDAWEGDHRDSRIVFIGKNLDRARLEEAFAACKATPAPLQEAGPP